MADKTTHLGMNLPLGTELTDQELYNENFVTLDTEVARRLTAVNGVKANENGEAIVTEVPFARQIVSDEQQQSSAEYTFRTTGGEASLEDGDATLVGIYGRSVHTGVANEVFTMTVTSASRTGGAEPITATINKSTFIAYVSNPASITVELLYTDMWSANPALYGITVTGTPVSGDAITVEYVRPDRGMITPSNPTQFVSTGWNLYNNAVGYARVKKYSDQYNFIIDGAYTSLKFSETYDGVRQSISVLSNRFSVPSDGYVWVTGGDATTTCIYMTWSDWNRGYEGEWKAYEESVVDFSDYTDSAFPYGMCQVGPVADEIDFGLKRMIRRIDRTAYSTSTIETLINTGVAYEADTDYIYYALANPIVTDFDVTNIYTANDHGEEILDGDVAPLVLTLYGENLVEKLQHDIPNQIAANSSAISKLNLTVSKTSQSDLETEMSNYATGMADGTHMSGYFTPRFNNSYFNGTPGTFILSRRYSGAYVAHYFMGGMITSAYYYDNVWHYVVFATKSDVPIITRKTSNHSSATTNSSGYVEIDTYSSLGVDTSLYCIGMIIRGWSGNNPGMTISKGSNGSTFFLTGPASTTFTGFTVEYYFINLVS